MFLYFRTLLLMVIGIFTSRITLQALGIDNYGIVNVISGFVAMFALVSGSLTGACQRFITYELGKTNPDVRNVFNASFYIHLALALIIIIFAETFGLYFVENKLNLPDGSHTAAQWVFQCSIVSFVISLINIPYNAIIIAHEKMAVFAYISLIEGFLKLMVVVALLYINTDKLILYAILSLCSSVLIRIIFQIYCRKAFGEMVSIRKRIDSALAKQIFGFAGWTFIGNSATIVSNQGVNIVINIFCGVAVNAARGIAVMVESVVTSFVTNFTTALNPQITKTYASGEISKLEYLVDIGVRISFFLMLIIIVPAIIAAEDILGVWFVDVPSYAPIFLKYTLIYSIIQAVGTPFLTVLIANGNIKSYQIAAGVTTFLNLPISYILLKLNFSPVYTYITLILISFTTFLIRLIFVRNVAKLKLNHFIHLLAFKILPCGIVAFILSFVIAKIVPHRSFFELVSFGLISCVLTSVTIYTIGLNRHYRDTLKNTIRAKILKSKHD